MVLTIEIAIERSRLITDLRIAAIGIGRTVLFHVYIGSQTCADTQVHLGGIVGPPHKLSGIANLVPAINGSHVVFIQMSANSTYTITILMAGNNSTIRIGICYIAYRLAVAAIVFGRGINQRALLLNRQWVFIFANLLIEAVESFLLTIQQIGKFATLNGIFIL